MRLGINLMAWSGSIDPDALALFPRLAALGYDGVEIPIFAPEQIDTVAVRRACKSHELHCTVSTAMPRGASLLEPAEQEAGVAFLERCAATAAACGARIVCGPLYAPVGHLPGRPRTDSEWKLAVHGLRRAGERAATHGVTLAVELLNRFETHAFNTVTDGVALIQAVDHPAVGLHLDTFHLNIEEKDIPNAFLQAGPYLRHVHAAENDRGSVGSGHIPWNAVGDALRTIRYDGWIVAETFTAAIPEIAAATAIWRPIVPDGWTYATESMVAMKRFFR